MKKLFILLLIIVLFGCSEEKSQEVQNETESPPESVNSDPEVVDPYNEAFVIFNTAKYGETFDIDFFTNFRNNDSKIGYIWCDITILGESESSYSIKGGLIRDGNNYVDWRYIVKLNSYNQLVSLQKIK